MHKALIELIGSFFLMLVIGLTVIAPGAGAMAPVAIGAMLMVMVYAGGPISGGHYNPAVTLAVWLRGKCPISDVPVYMAAQVVGAMLAAWLVGVCKPDGAATAISLDVLPAFLVELAFTFALAFVVLNVATAKRTEGNSYFGLAIGFTVMASAYAAGNISGGVFNPAVAIGITLLGLISVGHRSRRPLAPAIGIGAAGGVQGLQGFFLGQQRAPAELAPLGALAIFHADR